MALYRVDVGVWENILQGGGRIFAINFPNLAHNHGMDFALETFFTQKQDFVLLGRKWATSTPTADSYEH